MKLGYSSAARHRHNKYTTSYTGGNGFNYSP